INAIAPGNVRTAMTEGLTPAHMVAVEALPVPINYGHDPLMDPVQIANVIAFIASPEASGINGVVAFVDGGTDALLHSEKVY
ncbi:MAG: SDR family oxidoreductase, partial [Raoultibacter sp.]